MPVAAAGRRFVLLLLCCLAPLASTAAQQDAPLTAFTANYQLSRSGLPIARTQVSLELLPDGGYLYRARTEPNAVVSLIREDLVLEESRGRRAAGRLRPDSYLYQRDGPGLHRSLRLEFDWPRQRVRIADDQSNWSMGIGPHTLDKLVQQLVFTRELKKGIRSARYQVADGGRLKDYSYQVLGEEVVTTALGRFETLKVQRSKDRGTPDYTLWLAPVLGYRPVRILRRHEGALYLMELVEFNDTLGRVPGSNWSDGL